jgi:hypothetical protein
MNPMQLIRLFAVAPLAWAAVLHAGEADKAAAPAANAPAQSSAPAAAPTQPANASATAATTTADKIAMVRPNATLEIMAEPSKVWKKIISSEGMKTFGVEGDKKKNLDKVGDNLHGTIAGDAGNVVVTHIAKETEWRAAFEPDKGNYVCSIRFKLQPQGKNTLLTYSDWYSDEKAGMVDQNLKETEKAMTESLARFKGLVEKTSAAGNP